MGGGGLISGLACGQQCRCRTRPCHRQRLVPDKTRRPSALADTYDAVVSVSRLAVSRVFRGEVAYIFATDPPTHFSSIRIFPKRPNIISDRFILFSCREKIRGPEKLSFSIAFFVSVFRDSPNLIFSRPLFRRVARENPSKY